MQTSAHLSIEVIRTFIAVAEAGSLSKASDRIGLSQPSVSAQMKQLQGRMGGVLLTKSANGTEVTHFGRLILNQARRLVEAFDTLLEMSGGTTAEKPLRLAISPVLLPLFVRADPSNGPNVCLIADHWRKIKKGLVEGCIDVGCGFATPSGLTGLEDLVVAQYPLPFAWVRSKSFVMSPGKPLPVIGLSEDDYMIRPLQRNATAFRFALQTADMQARFEAVRAGLGFTAAPLAVIPSDLVVAKEYYLPKLGTIDALICCRPEFDRDKANTVIPYLEQILLEHATPAEKVRVSAEQLVGA